MSGWAAALRAARHDVRAARGRTALVLALVVLPVSAVVAGETLARTSDVSVEESLPQRIGAADALVRDDGISGPVQQDPLLETTSYAGDHTAAGRTTDEVLAQLPPGSRLLPLATGAGAVRIPGGLLDLQTREIDLRDPLARGLFPLASGRLPQQPGEVVVSHRLVRRELGPGAQLPLDGTLHPVVGTVDLQGSELGDAAVAVGLPGSLGAGAPSTWLVSVPGGLAWEQVQALNEASLYALSRAVVADPPPSSDVPISSSGDGPFLALVVTLALLQVVLLAAPAFAVGARRQKRVLALLGATGAEPAQVRRFVLAQGVVLGGLGGVGGAALGIAAAAALRPVLSHYAVDLGPFDVSARDTVLAAAIGALSAVLAALVPAVVAGNQDVLAGLTGRRGAAGRSLPSLGLGAVLFGVGVVGCVAAARPGSSEYAVVLVAVPTVVGAALLAPALLALVAGHARPLPFALRFAVRDAARTRGRTAAAAAAVTATVAGVVALGIGSASDSAQAAATWSPSSPPGSALVTYQRGGGGQDDRVRTAVETQLPGHRVLTLVGLHDGPRLTVEEPDGSPVLSSYGGSLNATNLVGESGLALLGLEGDQLDRAREELAGGGIVVAADRPSRTNDVVAVLTRGTGKRLDGGPLPAYRVPAAGGTAPVLGVVSAATAERLGLISHPVGLLVDGPIAVDQEQRLQEALYALGAEPQRGATSACEGPPDRPCSFAGRSPGFVSVERGYDDGGSAVAQLVLAGVGAVLVLGGTLSASLLALSDARPDFATLGAVGAAPGVRRAVAAAYAAVIGLLGALLGALAGLLPGIAVSYPLTRGYAHVEGLPSHFLDIPWLLLLGIAVGVPLVAALGAAALTRSRLPLTSRGID